jgi:hypothetical protein
MTSLEVEKNETTATSNGTDSALTVSILKNDLDSKVESANSVLSIRDNMNILIDEIEALSK